MYKIDLYEYLEKHPFSQEIYNKKFNDTKTMEYVNFKILYEDIMFDGKKSRFNIFIDGELATYSLNFPCGIDTEDLNNISDDIYSEYLEKVTELASLDDEIIFYGCDEDVIHKVESDNYKDKYYNENIELNKVWIKWSKKYGYNSIYHKQFIHEQIINNLSEYLKINGTELIYMTDLIDYLKMYSGRNCTNLFK